MESYWFEKHAAPTSPPSRPLGQIQTSFTTLVPDSTRGGRTFLSDNRTLLGLAPVPPVRYSRARQKSFRRLVKSFLSSGGLGRWYSRLCRSRISGLHISRGTGLSPFRRARVPGSRS